MKALGVAKHIDVLVIGGGHAGCQAAHISSRAGAATLLITQNITTIGEMSCNPSMGGVGKGHLIREVESLGGLIGKISDLSATHYRMLNQSKGYSAQGLRALIDRDLYKKHMLQTLNLTPNLTIVEGSSVEDFKVSQDSRQIVAVMLKDGQQLRAKQIVLTTGTFLGGMIHIGRISYPAGRHRRNSQEVQPPSNPLSDTIARLGFQLGRYKTGTPPRLSRKSINFTNLPIQTSQSGLWFSYQNQFNRKQHPNPLLPSHITRTNSGTLEVIKKNLHLLPQFEGGGEGIGPRYCPSIEAKFKRFPQIEGHTVFLQSQGLQSDIIFPTGLNTCLSQEVQLEMVKTIEGLENAEMIRPGYSIQYDFVNPNQLQETLRTKKLQNLYLAGQINGTTGYEQASAQGVIAGINAALAAQNKESYIPRRTNSMIGVLIGDIVSLGVSQPYRMLTTRSQHRLLQRFDNADQRLTPDAIQMGLISQSQRKVFEKKRQLVQQGMKGLEGVSWTMKQWSKFFPSKLTDGNPIRRTAADVIAKFHQISVLDMKAIFEVDQRVEKDLNIKLKYRTVLALQQKKAAKITEELLNTPIDMGTVHKHEAQFTNEDFQKLVTENPKTLYMATRIRGIRDTTIHTLAFLSSNKQTAN